MHRLLNPNPAFRALNQTSTVFRTGGFYLTHSSTSAAAGRFHLNSRHWINNNNNNNVVALTVSSCIDRRFHSSSPSNNNSNNNNNNNNNNNSSGSRKKENFLSLRRVPQRQEQPDPRRGKWRKHAVSLEFGNYEDYDDDHNAAVVSPMTAKPSWQDEEMDLAQQVQEIQATEDLKKKRWLENARPPVRVPIIDDRGRAYGRGGRKTASARVWIQPGFGHVVVNHRPLEDYFDRQTDRELILAPFAATQTCGKFDVSATVTGGGLTGQAGAIRHGVARALNHFNPDQYRPALKRLGYLTRDPRKVERKKIGRIKARKSPQWVKR